MLNYKVFNKSIYSFCKGFKSGRTDIFPVVLFLQFNTLDILSSIIKAFAKAVIFAFPLITQYLMRWLKVSHNAVVRDVLKGLVL
ncbi:hypothetical protein RBH29_17470 [Herbivorax sp. ANBcel31]|uniref:hypothetical protein n=1 Tax=Herbivorax sp. ANBcel31 TaxID=3069754 RepID=UPI0027AF900D|nr:hypothetical protein [Herbivorax sp. ANBcel31]MDQ2088216.1 hypothetical protein [Herbivorax sp. ANBcel31]